MYPQGLNHLSYLLFISSEKSLEMKCFNLKEAFEDNNTGSKDNLNTFKLCTITFSQNRYKFLLNNSSVLCCMQYCPLQCSFNLSSKFHTMVLYCNRSLIPQSTQLQSQDWWVVQMYLIVYCLSMISRNKFRRLWKRKPRLTSIGDRDSCVGNVNSRKIIFVQLFTLGYTFAYENYAYFY